MRKYLKIVLIVLLITILLSLLTLVGLYHSGKLFNSKQYNVVVLHDGLGNQMFEYAFGKALEKRTGKKVLYDNSPLNYSNRQYSLDIFNLNINFVTDQEMKKIKNILQERNPFIYDKYLFQADTPTIFLGYFQNEQYFKKISASLKRDFQFPPIDDDDDFNKHWLQEIEKAKNPVFIHVRRGDYLGLKRELPASYYKNAIEYIQKTVKDPTYFIFGIESKDFIEKALKLDVPYFVVGETNHVNHEDWNDMMLMSKCKHAIIANSTFSWWAAWLGPNQKGGIVVAPTPFVDGQDEIICDNWVKIKR